MEDCIFCKIAKHEITTTAIYEDELCLAFLDMSPVAPQHILLIPKKHFVSLNEVGDEALLGHMMFAAAKIAKDQRFSENGYRVVVNTGKDGGQSVSHLHMHILAGRKLAWPPG